MGAIRSHTDLRVNQEAMDACMIVFELTKRFPRNELYGMVDQYRRASRSVPANIAEAWRKRRYPAHWISKLSDAEGESAETQVWTEISLRCEYLSVDEAGDLKERYDKILAQLVTMIAHPEHWTIR